MGDSGFDQAAAIAHAADIEGVVFGAIRCLWSVGSLAGDLASILGRALPCGDNSVLGTLGSGALR